MLKRIVTEQLILLVLIISSSMALARAISGESSQADQLICSFLSRMRSMMHVHPFVVMLWPAFTPLFASRMEKDSVCWAIARSSCIIIEDKSTIKSWFCQDGS